MEKVAALAGKDNRTARAVDQPHPRRRGTEIESDRANTGRKR